MSKYEELQRLDRVIETISREREGLPIIDIDSKETNPRVMVTHVPSEISRTDFVRALKEKALKLRTDMLNLRRAQLVEEARAEAESILAALGKGEST